MVATKSQNSNLNFQNVSKPINVNPNFTINGLTWDNTNDAVVLGGTLDRNTDIDYGSNTLTIRSGTEQGIEFDAAGLSTTIFYNNGSGDTADIVVNQNTTTLFSGGSGNTNYFTLQYGDTAEYSCSFGNGINYATSVTSNQDNWTTSTLVTVAYTEGKTTTASLVQGANTINFDHNLKKNPKAIIARVTATGEIIVPDTITYPSINRVTLTFFSPFTAALGITIGVS